MPSAITRTTFHLPSLPTAKNALAISAAILTITSLGAYLYFYGLPPMPSMSWKLAAASAALVTASAGIAYAIFKPSSSQAQGAPRENPADLAIQNKIQALSYPKDPQPPSNYEDIKAYFAKSPEKAELMFRKTVTIDSFEVFLISQQLSLKLITDFAGDKKWLEAMVKGTLDRRPAGILIEVFKDCEKSPELKTALSNICEILQSDQKKLARILTCYSWEAQIDLFRVLLSRFDLTDETLLQDLLDKNFPSTPEQPIINSSWVTLLLREFAALNEAQAFTVVSYLRKQELLSYYFKDMNKDSMSKSSQPQFFPLVKFLKKDELEEFRRSLFPNENKIAFDLECLKILREGNRPTHVELPNFSTDQPLKIKELSRLELAVLNYVPSDGRHVQYRSIDIAILNFTPFHALKVYFESLSADQLSKALTIYVKKDEEIFPWMEEQLIVSLALESEDPKKWMDALAGIEDVEWIKKIFISTPLWKSNAKPFLANVFVHLDEEKRKKILHTVDWEYQNQKLFEILLTACIAEESSDALRKLLIAIEPKSLRNALSLLGDRELFNTVIPKLTNDQLFAMLIAHSNFSVDIHSHLLEQCCLNKDFVQEVKDFSNDDLAEFIMIVHGKSLISDPVKKMLQDLVIELENSQKQVTLKGIPLKTWSQVVLEP